MAVAAEREEELRATKRIEQTHRRTQEILAAKNRHQHQMTQRDKMKNEHGDLVEEHRVALAKLREERKQAMEAAKVANAARAAAMVAVAAGGIR